MDKYWDIITEGFQDERSGTHLGLIPREYRIWFTNLRENFDAPHHNRIISRKRYEKHKILREIPLYKVIYG